eukprot:TRINITY_DN5098_c1_g1_i1.p2 TRINITY_DN5098_c1_g1~~TRINITY_DN5098_c1_g1_i1.p2  ORF type:complete len:212 (+),score=106.89 TRINITY_DN5098_c1_g1_i1:125-760(+)
MFEKRIVIDCKGHLLGRLASVVAKELLNGQKIVCVRTEEINISGTFGRNKVKYMAFLRKRMNVNPKKGPLHLRSPSKILWRTIRGMVPHKTARGAKALQRLKVFEGVPPPYNRTKRVVVPQALRILRLAPGRPFCVLKRLSFEFGWKHSAAVEKLEFRRKIKSSAWHTRQAGFKNLRSKAIKSVSKSLNKKNSQLGNKSISAVLQASGYKA